MITSETLHRIRRIEIQTRKKVNGSLVGAYHSAFKGRGIELDSIRSYEPGDDIRSIDWNVTARTGNVSVRQYVEERELTVLLLLDVSASFLFGSASKTKRDVAAEVAAVIAFSAIFNHDRVGLIMFSDHTEVYVPPRNGRNHVLRLIRDLIMVEPEHKETDITSALRKARRVLKRRSIVFLFSDLLAPLESYINDLSLLAFRHELIVLMFSDPTEHKMPEAGLLHVHDAETGQMLWIDTDSPKWQAQYSLQSTQLMNRIKTALSNSNADLVPVNIGEDYVNRLDAVFRARAASRR